MNTRRDFLKKIGLTSAAVGLIPSLIPDLWAAGDRKLDKIGLITNTVGPAIKADAIGTLRKLSEIGYRELEFGGTFGLDKQVLKSLLTELNITPVAGGASMYQLRTDLKTQVENCNEFNKKYLVCYWPWEDDGKNKKLDDWKEVAEKINKIGKKAKREGLTLAYHNHAIEFELTEGQIPYDTLMKYIDPEYSTMELDLYWIWKGGKDPIEYIKKYPGRFQIAHVKDMDSSPEKTFACVGSGVIDFAEIFALSEMAGFKHYIVEHDKPAEPIECATSSYEYLRALRF